jgi:hypothetical protein
MADLSLSEKLLLLEEELTRRRIRHAFGGAIALAYYATPRATIDLDLNVFVGVAEAQSVLSLLRDLGADAPSESEQQRLERDGQARVSWQATPVDLFFSYDAFHDSCSERRQRMPFGDGDTIHVLSAEDLVVFKAIFDRAKDWRDIGELLFAMGDAFDAAYAKEWLARIVGPDDERYRRLEEALAAVP